MTTLRMLGNRLAVRARAQRKTLGGIIIPEMHADETNVADVLFAGPKASCKPGDVIIVKQWAHEPLSDMQCASLGLEPGVRVLKEDNVCMRNGAPMPGFVVVLLDPKASLFDAREGDGIVQAPGFIGLAGESALVAAQPTTGTVLAAGERCECSVGERVTFGKYNGCALEQAQCAALGHAGRQVFVMREAFELEVGRKGNRKLMVPGDEIYARLESEG